MIKITSFYPFQSFLRVIQEFHEDNAIVKMKSLTFERQYEFEYKDVGEITDTFHADEHQMGFSFWILALTTFTLVVFCNFIYATPILLRIEQVLYTCGIILFITSIGKRWRINIIDKKDNYLTYIKQTSKNQGLISQVTALINSKAKDLRRITTADPFPEEKPVFEHIEFDIAKLKKTTDKFYEDKVIGYQKNIFNESSYIIMYSQLNKKIFRVKSGNSAWFSYLGVIIFLGVLITGFRFAFNINPDINFSLSFRILLVLGVILWLLSFVKREAMGLLDKNGNVSYWTYVNRNNKAKIEKIIEFIQSKIPAENT